MISSASQRGDVVQMDFPFADGGDAKGRPALILAGPSAHGDYIVVMMSSQKHEDGVPIDPPDFSTGSLNTSGFARVGRIFTVHGGSFTSKRGALKPAALQRVQAAVCPAIGCKT